MNLVHTPFLHAVQDVGPELEAALHLKLADCVAEFPDEAWPGWRWYQNERELKAAREDVSGFPNCTKVLSHFQSPSWVSALESLFGIPELSPDTLGGGMHMIPTGGHLGVHVDFNRGRDGLYRRLNLLLYLNHNWNPSWGGCLELHETASSGPSVSVVPELGRLVVFATSESSWHGHPAPHTAPVPRRSLAVYYYSPEPPSGGPAEPHSTVFL